MKILFMGTPEFAVASLQNLVKNHDVVAVVTQPDKKKGRGNKISFSPVKEEALKHNIEILQPIKIKDEEFIHKLIEFKADIFVVVAYGQILSKKILEIPRFGCINVHGSLLPKFRGAAPIQQAIIDGEEKTGITIMFMNEGLDTGDMFLKEEVIINDSDNFKILHNKLKYVGANLLIEAIEQIEKNCFVRIKQNESEASYSKIITKEFGHINFNKTGKDIVNLIRALDPWPSSYTYLNGNMIKIWNASIYNSNKIGKPGEVLEIEEKQGFVLKTGDGAIIVNELQSTSGKRMKCSDYLRGNKIEIGNIFL